MWHLRQAGGWAIWVQYPSLSKPRSTPGGRLHVTHGDSWLGQRARREPCPFSVCLIFWWVILPEQTVSGREELCRPCGTVQWGGNTHTPTTPLGTILSRYPPSYLHLHPLIPLFKRPSGTMHLTAVRQTDLGSKLRKEMPPPGEPPCHQQTQLKKQLAPPPRFSVPSWARICWAGKQPLFLP